jgi:molybdopterin/thiamine biosynthesis adenylyltransferase
MTIMNYARQTLIITPEQLAGRPVIIIGVGSIGSNLLRLLVQLGCREFILYDDDRVAPENLPNQGFDEEHLGMLKVEAAQEILLHLGATSVTINPVRYEGPEQGELEGIVICGVDSIAARTAIWQNAVQGNENIELYLDGRLGGEELTLFTMEPYLPHHQDYYEVTLHSPEQSAQLPCGAESVITAPAMLAAWIVNQIVRFVRGEEYRHALRFRLTDMRYVPGTWS